MQSRHDSHEVRRPWGSFAQYTEGMSCTVKVITVAPGEALSRQYHRYRDELWVVLDAGVRVEVEDETFEPEVGAEFFIPRKGVSIVNG